MPLDAWHLGWPAEAFHRPGQDDAAFGALAAEPFHGRNIRILASTPPPGSDPQLWARGASNVKSQFATDVADAQLQQDWTRRALQFLDRPFHSSQPTSCSSAHAFPHRVAGMPEDVFLQRPLDDSDRWPQGNVQADSSIQSVGHNYFYSDVGGKAEIQESETQCHNGDCRTIEHRVLPQANAGPLVHNGGAYPTSRPDLCVGCQRPPHLRMAWDVFDDIGRQVGHLLSRRMPPAPRAAHWQMPHLAEHSQNGYQQFMYSNSNGNHAYTETVTKCRDGHCETTKRVIEPHAAGAAGAIGPAAAGADLGNRFMPSTGLETLQSNRGAHQGSTAEEPSKVVAPAQMQHAAATTGGIGAATDSPSTVEEAMAMLQKKPVMLNAASTPEEQTMVMLQKRPEMPNADDTQEEPAAREG